MNRARTHYLLLLLLIPTALHSYIIITDIGGDIDDVLALCVAFGYQSPPQAIIATHHLPIQKAPIAKLIASQLGYPAIPVYIGHGCTAQDSREAFMDNNPLWPSIFGFLDPVGNERRWNPTQAQAYKKVFGVGFDTLHNHIRNDSVTLMLIQGVKELKGTDKLDIIVLGPLHDIYNALNYVRQTYGNQAEFEFAQKIRLWAMGGTYPFGYNWLISPETTAYTLSRIETICITSQFVRNNGLLVTTKEFDVLRYGASSNKLSQAIMGDWINWNADDQLKNAKNLFDPVTMYLFLHPEQITNLVPMHIEWPCLNDQGYLKKEWYGIAYNSKGLENQIIRVTPTARSMVTFVEGVKDASQVRREVLYSIAKIFYPSVSSDQFWELMDREDLNAQEIALELAHQSLVL